ncbi:MAG: PH domain-containing protein [Calditrichia bacterium]|nr:PH domain-containing protein [Calditrichia bacterium]
MENYIIKPAIAQKKIWHLLWVLYFMLGSLMVTFISLNYFTGLIFYFAGIWIVMSFMLFFWISAFHNSLKCEVEVDTIRMQKGAIWNKKITIPAPKITNIDITQGPFQKRFGIGNIYIRTSGAQGSQSDLVILGVDELDEIRNSIMERASYEQIKQEVAAEKDSEMLSRILKEVSKIRQTLEKKGRFLV